MSVIAPLNLMRAAIPEMAERGWGRVVNVSSTAGKRPSSMMPDYSVGKAAMLSLSRQFAERHAAEGVMVNAICPGPTASIYGWPKAACSTSRRKRRDMPAGRKPLKAAGGTPGRRLASPERSLRQSSSSARNARPTYRGAAWGMTAAPSP